MEGRFQTSLERMCDDSFQSHSNKELPSCWQWPSAVTVATYHTQVNENEKHAYIFRSFGSLSNTIRLQHVLLYSFVRTIIT